REDFQDKTKVRCDGLKNVEFRLGDSREVLSEVVDHLEAPAMFWLDAHAGIGLFGEKDDWPILDELRIINRSSVMHYVLIDDAHCFLDGSPQPACPRIEEVERLAREGGYSMRIAHDCIALVPRFDQSELDEFGGDDRPQGSLSLPTGGGGRLHP